MLGAVGILVLGDICPRLYRWGTCCDSWYRSILLYLFLIGGGLGCLLWANGGGDEASFCCAWPALEG